eukprot:TRINITY_DN667_c0_g1_i1.p1 TRINITY_DN667_c0_g1~~TRINITY_DN667_c0_g1_i1.p1  ORF type:complete len:410 (+),score=119.27 TRINITY_DN667_c0_g1_i1:136-1365(+)
MNFKKIAEFLDTHLLLRPLQFLRDKEILPIEVIAKAQYEVAIKTKMIDWAIERYKEFNKEEVPSTLLEKRKSILQSLENSSKNPLVKLLEKKEIVEQMIEENQFKFEVLEKKYEISRTMVEELYEYSRLKFDVGFYPEAAEYLKVYIYLHEDKEPILKALWGKLASEILVGNLKAAVIDVDQIKSVIEKSKKSPLELTKLRAWLIHWSLFIFFSASKGILDFLNLFMEGKYLNSVQTLAPHLIRYYAVAAILTSKRKGMVAGISNLIKQERYIYSDPFTEFIFELYVNNDFTAAQNHLSKVDEAIRSDFFLQPLAKDIMHKARLSIFELTCATHNCIDISQFDNKITKEEAERWIADLTSNQFDAKIDSEKNLISISTRPTSIHQNLLEKLEGILLRSNVLSQLITNQK